ncbi:MAG: GLPGLI family protein [Ferruginibacter sp.]
MKILILLSAFFLCISANAQKSYLITYKGNYLTDLGFLSHFGNPVFIEDDSRLVFNDSISYFFSLQKNENRFRKKIYGQQMLDHSMYFNKRKGIIESVFTKHDVQDNYLVYDSTKVVNWVLLDQTKIINGFTCFAALTISGDNDSTLAFYTKEIPLPFGPDRYNNLPGVILEIYDQYLDWHLLATKIDTDDFTISYPKKYNYISQKEFSLQEHVIYGKRRVSSHPKQH